MTTAVLASVDGEVMPPEEATISILDDGLLRGDGAFEVIKLYGGHPFRLEDHYARLRRSAAAIELEVDIDALRSELDALVAENADPDGCLRVVATRGGRRVLTIERCPMAGERQDRADHADAERGSSRLKSISYAGTCRPPGWPPPAAPTRPSTSAPTASSWRRRPPRSSDRRGRRVLRLRRLVKPEILDRSPATSSSPSSTWWRVSSSARTARREEAFLASPPRDPPIAAIDAPSCRSSTAGAGRAAGALERPSRASARSPRRNRPRKWTLSLATSSSLSPRPPPVRRRVHRAASARERPAQRFDAELARELGEMGYLGAR